MIKEKIQCDICSKVYRVNPKQKYDLEKAGFIIYCQGCADKLNLDRRKALAQGFKIYKM